MRVKHVDFRAQRCLGLKGIQAFLEYLFTLGPFLATFSPP